MFKQQQTNHQKKNKPRFYLRVQLELDLRRGKGQRAACEAVGPELLRDLVELAQVERELIVLLRTVHRVRHWQAVETHTQGAAVNS